MCVCCFRSYLVNRIFCVLLRSTLSFSFSLWMNVVYLIFFPFLWEFLFTQKMGHLHVVREPGAFLLMDIFLAHIELDDC